jgi:hypothetical protein
MDGADPGGDRHAPPPLAGQYVGWGTALHGASAHHITINNSFHGSTPGPSTSRAAPNGPAPRQFEVLGRLPQLTSRLLVLADRVHAAAEALAGLSVPSGYGPPHSSRVCSCAGPDADRLRRNAWPN